MPGIRTLLLLICAAAYLSGCAYLRPTRSKLDAFEYKSVCSDSSPNLLVILPGRYDTPQDVVNHGFVRAVARRGIDTDIVIPDLHFGYYMERSAVVRLHEDVIAPARDKAYKKIWLAGISLGGFGSLLYAQQHAELADGMLLIAPYLGEPPVRDEIIQAGGLGNWKPRDVGADDYERRLWLWLRDHGSRAGSQPPLYIGFGTDDAFAQSNRLLASRLPAERVMPAEGGHDWAPWLQVWEEFLDKRLIASCPPETPQAGGNP